MKQTTVKHVNILMERGESNLQVMKNDSNMLEEYDFSNGIRGKYVSKYKDGTNIIRLDTELIEYFPDTASVNEALRSFANLMKKYKNKKAKRARSVDA